MISTSQFGHALRRVGGASHPTVVVALSGGVDSMCLTHLLRRYRDEQNPHLSIHAVTIDHQYREGLAEEAEKVGQTAREWGVSHEIHKLFYDRPIGEIGNFEEVARAMRYHTFHRVCSRLGAPLMVAHNLDDQLETFLLRLQQNSLLHGLVGLRGRSSLPLAPSAPDHNVSVLRPLLGFTKTSIIDTCKQAGVQWFEDITNADPHLTRRNLLRHVLKQQTIDSVLSPAELVASHELVVAMDSLLEEKAQALLQWSNPQYDWTTGLLQLQVPKKVDTQVLSRALYKALWPISSVKHYHWSYAKLERHAVPQIQRWLNSPPHPLRLTILNLAVELRATDCAVNLSFSRQPLLREDIARNTHTLEIGPKWTPWLHYDRRFWLRFRSRAPLKAQLAPYQPKRHSKDLKNLEISAKRLTGVPVLTCDGGIVALPTLGFAPDIDVECRHK